MNIKQLRGNKNGKQTRKQKIFVYLATFSGFGGSVAVLFPFVLVCFPVSRYFSPKASRSVTGCQG